MKDVFTLPEGFGAGDSDTLIYFYSNNKSSRNNKVIFTKNMVCLVQQGVKEVQTAKGKETITNKETLLLTAGSTLMSESVATNNKYEAILIFFGNKTLTDFCARHNVPVMQKHANRIVLKIHKDDFINHYTASLQLLHGQNATGMYQLKIHELLGYLHIKYSEIFQRFVAQALANTSDIKLQQVVELNRDKHLTVEELAFLCDMSISTFKRHFTDIYKVPPQKYFTQLRMEEARVLLAAGKRPSEIYARFNYENLSAFSNEFKKHFGRSPKYFSA